MELLTRYLIKKRNMKNNNKVKLNYDSRWEELHETNEHKISIFAGIGLGGESNVALKALNSSKNVIIYTTCNYHTGSFTDKIKDIIYENKKYGLYKQDYTINEYGNNDKTVIIDNYSGKEIKIINVGTEGYSWRNSLVFVLDFENPKLEKFILTNINNGQIRQAYQFVCIGMMKTTEPTFAKSWFKKSDLGIYIDHTHPRMDVMTDSKVENVFPSRFKSLVEHSPPIDIEFNFTL